MHSENEVVYLYLDDIIPNRFQPRELFDERALKELAVSIKEHGVIQPIIVRKNGEKYEIIAGERRYKAAALAGLTKIPAIIRDLDDKESSKVALLENLQRKNLNPIEEAKTYQKILEIDQMTQEELAKTMGKSQSAVANKLRLLTLSEGVQNALLNAKISERHARTLLTVDDKEEQDRLVKRVIENRITVRELERIIKQEREMPEEIEREEPKPIEKPHQDSDVFKEPLFDDEDENDGDSGESFSKQRHKPPMPDTMIDYDDVNKELNNDREKKEEELPERDGANFRPMMDTPTAPAPNYGEIDPDLHLQEDDEENPEDKFQFTSTPEVSSNDFNNVNDDFFNSDNNRNENLGGSSLDSLLNINPPKPRNNDSYRREEPRKNKKQKQEDIDDLYDDIDDTSYEDIDYGDVEHKNNYREPRLEDEEKYNVHSSSFDESLFKTPTIEDFEQKNDASEFRAHSYKPSSYRGALRRELNPEEEEKPKKSVNSDVQSGINAIRDTIRRLEKEDLKIDTDEMNFENSYQIVIKIQKPVPEDE